MTTKANRTTEGTREPFPSPVEENSMHISITRTILPGKFHYILSVNDVYFGEVNWTFGLKLMEILISDKNDSCIMLKQTNWIIKLLNLIPPLNITTITPFKLYVEGKLIGKGRKKFAVPAFEFKTIHGLYEIRLHNNNYCSLMLDNEQIALYKREPLAVMEKANYTVMYEAKLKIPLVLLFGAFMDAVFYTQRGELTALRYEKNLVPHDKHDSRTLWVPSDSPM